MTGSQRAGRQSRETTAILKIHCIQTGAVRIKAAQRRREPGGLAKILLSARWTDWLPILAWVIEHPEGLIVVDTGETSRASTAGYFPWWHPYFRLAVRINVAPDQELGPQMRLRSLDPADVRKLILTHLHTDHAGGLHEFPNARMYVSETELGGARGLSGILAGYLPHRWPGWFEPETIAFQSEPFGPFDRSWLATGDGDVVVVPTPGHTAGHVSVVVTTGGVRYFLAGDTSYTEALLRARHPDGVSPNTRAAAATIDAILRLGSSEPTVYLPSHDPSSKERLARIETL